MPPVSQAQRRWAWVNRNKRGEAGKAAREFADADPGGKLPAKVKNGKAVKTRSERWYGKKES